MTCIEIRKGGTTCVVSLSQDDKADAKLSVVASGSTEVVAFMNARREVSEALTTLNAKIDEVLK